MTGVEESEVRQRRVLHLSNISIGVKEGEAQLKLLLFQGNINMSSGITR